MTREEYIKNLKNQGKVTVKDLAELLTFTLDKGNELMFEDDHVEVYIPINFDVDKVFGFDVCKTDNGDWVNLYLCWYPNKDAYDTKVKMYLYYCNNSTDDDDFELEVALTWDQHNAILRDSQNSMRKPMTPPSRMTGKNTLSTVRWTIIQTKTRRNNS